MNAALAKTDFEAWTGRFVRRLRRRHNEHCANIVTYHCVAQEDNAFTDGTSLRHDPATFERQINYLAEHFNPIHLRELVEALEQGRAPRRAVVVTFDDGFADSIRKAMPILYRCRIPMTIFPVTSVIGNTDLMWQHKLTWLESNGHSAKVAEALASAGLCDGRPLDQGEPMADYARCRYCADLPDVLEDVLQSVGISGPRLAGALRPYLEAEEIAEADPDFVQFGNHTHTHAILSALTADQQRAEIVAARRALETLTGEKPIALAYPFGLKRHYDADSRRIAQETGHRAALDMRRRINVGCVDPFELSRKPATCRSQVDFEKTLEDWPANIAMDPAGGDP